MPFKIPPSLYERARNRVMDSEALRPYTDFILADWPEGDEHWQWVIHTSEAEILEWIGLCLG